MIVCNVKCFPTINVRCEIPVVCIPSWLSLGRRQINMKAEKWVLGDSQASHCWLWCLGLSHHWYDTFAQDLTYWLFCLALFSFSTGCRISWNIHILPHIVWESFSKYALQFRKCFLLISLGKKGKSPVKMLKLELYTEKDVNITHWKYNFSTIFFGPKWHHLSKCYKE